MRPCSRQAGGANSVRKQKCENPGLISNNSSQLLTTVNEWALAIMIIDYAKYPNDHGIGARCDGSISFMEIAAYRSPPHFILHTLADNRPSSTGAQVSGLRELFTENMGLGSTDELNTNHWLESMESVLVTQCAVLISAST